MLSTKFLTLTYMMLTPSAVVANGAHTQKIANYSQTNSIIFTFDMQAVIVQQIGYFIYEQNLLLLVKSINLQLACGL